MTTSASRNRTALANAVEQLRAAEKDLKTIDLRAYRGKTEEREAVQEARAATGDALYAATEALASA